MCRLLWQACQRVGVSNASTVIFNRNSSILKLSGHSDPVLSIFRSPGKISQGPGLLI